MSAEEEQQAMASYMNKYRQIGEVRVLLPHFPLATTVAPQELYTEMLRTKPADPRSFAIAWLKKRVRLWVKLRAH